MARKIGEVLEIEVMDFYIEWPMGQMIMVKMAILKKLASKFPQLKDNPKDHNLTESNLFRVIEPICNALFYLLSCIPHATPSSSYCLFNSKLPAHPSTLG